MYTKTFVAGSVFGRNPHDNQTNAGHNKHWPSLLRRIRISWWPALKALVSVPPLYLSAVLVLGGPLSATETDEPQASLKVCRQTIESLQLQLKESELARKSAVQHLAIALAAKKAQDTGSLNVNNEARALRKRLHGAGETIGALTKKLAMAEASAAEARSAQQRQRKAFQMVTEKAEAAAAEVVTLSQRAQRWKRRNAYLIAKKEALERERDELNQKYELMQQLAERLESAVKNSLSDREKHDQQVRAELAKAKRQEAELAELKNSFELERKIASDEIAAAHAAMKSKNEELKNSNRVVEKLTLEVEELREQLAAEQKRLSDMRSQIADARSEVNTARDVISERIDKLITVAVAPPSATIVDLEEKLAAAREQIARLKAEIRNASTTPSSQ